MYYIFFIAMFGTAGSADDQCAYQAVTGDILIYWELDTVLNSNGMMQSLPCQAKIRPQIALPW